ncbi:TetR/AcrR family transcriptional regulator [Nonomuraea sp. NN258]|uniref:TetR/AcrR family transcriptional regulator n=1 Tax=Nonomuraea antri TaxID=2730852 RepID=UPI001568F0D1|nr:TetR/AcrR family transcriptional regulator [Nonomuraea antri]NRQ36607.1 TetR/AcrR family transcriptional regulator [Nonomuraea antri]
MPRRADAQRNHDLLLAAARQVFAERGADAPLDDVARRAGVGNATLYRNFPTRGDLLVAVYADEVADLCARGETLLAAESPGEALHEWLLLFVEHVAAKRELALAIRDDPGAQPRSELLAGWHTRILGTVTALLDAAQAAGAARADLDVHDLVALAKGVALAATDPTQAARLLALIQPTPADRTGDHA